MLPHARAHAGLGQFEDDGSDAADEHGDRVLEHPPGYRLRRDQRGLPHRRREIDSPRIRQTTPQHLEPALDPGWQAQHEIHDDAAPRNRRPSTHCQPTSVGTPQASSRMRLTMPTASAISPLMPTT